MTAPPAGQAQPLAERVTGLTEIFAVGAFGAGKPGLVSGGGVGTGVATTGGVVLAGAAGGGAGRVAIAPGTCRVKRIVCPG